MSYLGAWLVSSALLSPVAAGASSVAAPNPYQWIATRNVFGLRPPQVVKVAAPAAPQAKVTLTGITTIFGDKRALLKVQLPTQPSKPPPKEQDLMLAEGQRSGNIQVLEVNAKMAQVKVDNAGTISVITFEKPKPAPAPAVPAAFAQRPRPIWPRLPMPQLARRY